LAIIKDSQISRRKNKVLIKRIKEEIYVAKSYIAMSLIIIILTILPQMLFSPTIRHTVYLFIIGILMILLAQINKIIFALFAFYINITNIIIGHIAMHWGYIKSDIAPRLYVMATSPRYETLEYLKNYIDYRDVFLVFIQYCYFFLF